MPRLRGVGHPQDLGVPASGGTFTGPVVFDGGADLNGTTLIIDADADSSISSVVDDTVLFKTGGSTRVTLTDSALTVDSGTTLTANGAATFANSFTLTPTTITSANSPYTLGAAPTLYCNATGGAITVNLPAAVAGRQYIIEKTDSSANAVTINRAGSDTIEGATSFVLPTQYDQIVLEGHASGWYQTNNVMRLRAATANLNASTIVGTSSGTLGHASGVTAVSAVTGYRIMVEQGVLTYTFATAAYTGGGNVYLQYGDNTTVAITNTLSAASTFGAANSRALHFIQAANINAAATYGIGQAVQIATPNGTPFTQPGTAAGTAVVTIYYRIVSV